MYQQLHYLGLLSCVLTWWNYGLVLHSCLCIALFIPICIYKLIAGNSCVRASILSEREVNVNDGDFLIYVENETSAVYKYYEEYTVVFS